MIQCDGAYYPGKTRARGYLEVVMQLQRSAKAHCERRLFDVRVPEHLLELHDLILHEVFSILNADGLSEDDLRTLLDSGRIDRDEIHELLDLSRHRAHHRSRALSLGWQKEAAQRAKLCVSYDDGWWMD